MLYYRLINVVLQANYVVLQANYVVLQANWYKSSQYCRFHGMHLASINSVEEQTNLEEHIQSIGKKIF